MKVAIIGDGLLGRSLMDVLAGHDRWTASLLGHADIEITSRESVERALAGKYDVAINTVAMHRLPACENDPMLARLINTEGASYVAATLPTVFVSTDYVFNDGGPHDESLPGAEPRSVYGRTKLAGEIATLESGGIVARVSYLFGHHRSHKGPTFPEMVTSSFDTLKLPVDQRFSPTYAPDAAERIAGLAVGLTTGHVTGIYHATNAGSTSPAEFAEQIIEVYPWRRHVVPYSAHDRLRPGNSALKSTRLTPLRHWRLALMDWADRAVSERSIVSPKRSEA